ncbi:DNA-binding MarR family transcriptional regulator [Lipingzhangella halophila]|uniref:DNA-binding MarR family transcriptional regulator n=1 Tax=Lipingzhangella halophila TaxID=1783352 RepID=A0A7W7RJF0_9ACTN|nr:MarR family transcriptional regulator [Lipingzhangella halophila]MBB4933081.1 DNA-binding MarR family transcriptional regulator [Lipingzhangella halophila]
MPETREDRPRVALPTPLEQRWQALRRLQGRVDEAAERAMQSRHAVSVAEYLALAALAYSDDGGHLRQQVLADAIPLNHSSVSRLVARLERAGLSERYLCESDRRGVYTQITAKGRHLVDAARQTYLDALREVLDDARDDDDLAPHIDYLAPASVPDDEAGLSGARPPK